VTPKLTWAQAAAWRADRHGLRERCGPDGALDVVARIAGLHAQVMSSAELSLHARVDGLDRDAVPRMLWEERSLYKTWAMRGTLHLLPSSERGMWQAALSAYLRRYELASWLKGFGVTAEQLAEAVRACAETLRDGQLTRAELAAAVAERSGPELGERVRESWGSFLKPVAFRGELCFAPSADQHVRFTHPDTFLPAASTVDPDEGLREVIRRYLGAYGPATRDDLSRWWSALSAAQAGRLLSELAVEVDVDGLRAYMLEEHVDEARAAEPERSVRLVPAFDPYVAGAPRAGHGIFPVERRAEIYRQAGWLTPAILVDGVIAGLYRQERKGSRLEIAVQPFGRFPKWMAAAVEAEAERLAAWLGLSLVLVVA
jgi:hypothetical protein